MTKFLQSKNRASFFNQRTAQIRAKMQIEVYKLDQNSQKGRGKMSRGDKRALVKKEMDPHMYMESSSNI
jgi:hypothetical protein